MISFSDLWCGERESDDRQFHGRHFVKDIILTSVRRHVASPLSYPEAALTRERGVLIDYTTRMRPSSSMAVRPTPRPSEAVTRRMGPRSPSVR